MGTPNSNPVTDNVGAGADSQNQSMNEIFIIELYDEFDPYLQRARIKVILDCSNLRDSLLEYLIGLKQTWSDCLPFDEMISGADTPVVCSLEQISNKGVEQVFPQQIDLETLLGCKVERFYEENDLIYRR